MAVPVATLTSARRVFLDTRASEEKWRAFESAFGPVLQATFTSDHRLSRVRALEQPGKAADRFKSGDRESALARANEILKSGSDLIGLNEHFPLRARSVRSDEISSQIEWVQTYQGIPVEPFGRISLSLDKAGGLRGLYSNYISDSEIENGLTLDESTARQNALSRVHFKVEHPERTEPGEVVLFAQGPQDTADPVPLRYAYRFWMEGREVIVDATQGGILSEKDRRQF